MRFALVAEGRADAPLLAVLERLCGDLGAADVRGEQGDAYLRLRGLETGRAVENKVAALVDLDPDFKLIFIHMDGDNEGLDVRRERITVALGRCGFPRPFARVVPVKMTESWLIVDEQSIRAVVGYPNGTADLQLPKRSAVERTGDAKRRLRDALARAKKPRKHDKAPTRLGDGEYAGLRDELLENLDIHGPVTELLAWRALVDDTKAALTELART